MYTTRAKPFPSMPLGFWQDSTGQKFQQTYFATFNNVWYHGDYIIIYSDGSVRFMGRSDATLNPHGVRIGTGEIYQVVENLAEISDSVAISQQVGADERIILIRQISTRHHPRAITHH